MMRLSSNGLIYNPSHKIEEIISNYPQSSISLEELWQLMDEVWDYLECDAININIEKINLFYSHPIWLLNGLFIEKDEISIQQKSAIANWIYARNNEIISIVDYGGGFGTLARLIAEKHTDLVIDIYEPHPSQIAINETNTYTNVNFINSLNRQYNCLVSTDVLEHVVDPLSLLAEMIKSVELGGYLIISHCFYPVIKCHLPATFHLRYTFTQFAKVMGLDVIGPCTGSFATVYKKSKEQSIEWNKIRAFEKFSKALFPFFWIAAVSSRGLRKRIK
ncbi:MAG: methyltransferase domain-containing protein [Nostoc sp.]|uniref:methyltransferase domain-containing protein n=1 Tax=Nostoc sp. TaxID=1180 RepID=UPI002FF85DC5